MARKIDKSSVRQKALSRLNKLKKKSRSEAVVILMDEFSIGKSYAMTIYQHHRNALKVAGETTEVFQVRNHKDGKTVEPYMSSHFVLDAEDQPTSRSEAVKVFQTSLRDQIALAKPLSKAPVAEVAAAA